MSALSERIRRLPGKPGVYLFKDTGGAILYVGKARDLRARVRSYMARRASLDPKTRVLMSHAVGIDYIVTDNEVEALLLESTLIKEHNPRFNIVLRDDKSYPYIKVTLNEPFPRVYVTRRVVDDGARYFGPYTRVKLLRRNLSLVQALFPVRSCRYRLPDEHPTRACLDYHIHRCEAPCAGFVDERAYRAMIDDVVGFLAGDIQAATRMVKERMRDAARRLQFERAAGYKRQLDQLGEFEEGQRMTSLAGEDRDVIAIAREQDDACGVILRVRGGRMLGMEHHVLGNVKGEPDDAVLSLFMTRYYLQSDGFARELLLPFAFDDQVLIESALAERAERAPRIRVPQRGDKARQVALAERNARLHLEERRLRQERQTERASDSVLELQTALDLVRIPRSIACVDISTIQGTDSVGSVVTFANSRPRKAGYRRFKIKYVEGQNDFAMMAEVVERYFRGLLDHDDRLPDLLVIDGGKGQLSAARAILEDLGVADDLDVVGLAKREEEIYLPGAPTPVWLPRRSPALQIVQHIRNEAHRFAITYHRSLRTRRMIGSELDRVPGIGSRRRAALLHHFRSVDRIREVPVEEIARVPGFSLKLAERLKTALDNPVDERGNA